MRAAVALCFFLSGASGLIFQVIWSREFARVFGATTLALSAVLTAFMGGLALGSFLAGRIADRIKRPERIYAFAELGIGGAALAIPLIVSRFDGLNAWAYQSFGDSYIGLTAVRFIASAAVILVPTTLMGATLPLLSRFFIQHEYERARIGVGVGNLYVLNTAGAVLGTLAGGFVLLPTIGLSKTNAVAAGTNIVLGIIVLLLSRRVRAQQRIAGDSTEGEAQVEAAEMLRAARHAPPPVVQVRPSLRRLATGMFAVSGATAMCYQVIWTRALNMSIGSSVYAFTLVLAAFLIGLAGGAAVISRWSARTRHPVLWLAAVHLAVGVLAAGSTFLLDRLPFVYLALLETKRLANANILATHFIMILLVMLPATFAMGGIFPLTIRVASQGLDTVGRDVGRTYAFNTIGAIVGSFAAGYLVVPVLQLRMGILTCIQISLGCGLLLAVLAIRRPRVRLGFAAGVLAASAAVFALPKWDLYNLSLGLFRPTIARDALKSGRWAKPELVYYKDGISTTVTVEKWSEGHYSLKNNGKVDASTGDDMPTQIAVGLLPLVLHPDAPAKAHDVALIGFASGVTAGAVLQYPVRSVRVIELEPAIIKASGFFQHVNNQPLSDPRLKLIADDGRNFLAATAERFDVVINEPSNPWITGVSNLFTREYFQIAKARLKPGGLFCTWAQMYELSPRRIKSIYRAFSGVFPYVYAFSASSLSSDTFLMGSDRPLPLDLARLKRAFANKKIKAEFARAKIDSPHDIAALFLLGPKEVSSFVAGAVTNTDDNAYVEFAAPRDLFNDDRYGYYVSRLYGLTWLYGHLDDVLTNVDATDYAHLVFSLLGHGRLGQALRYEPMIKGNQGHAGEVRQLLRMVDPERDLGAIIALEEDRTLKPPILHKAVDPKWAAKVRKGATEVYRRFRRGDFCGALGLIEAWPEKVAEQLGEDFQLLWGVCAYHCEDFRAAVNILKPLNEDPAVAKRRPQLLYYLGHAFYGNADFADALKMLAAWLKAKPKPSSQPSSQPTSQASTPGSQPTSQPSDIPSWLSAP